MSYADPQTVTVSGSAKTLARTSSGDNRGAFSSVADGLKLSVTHVAGKRKSSTVRLDINKVAADPLLNGVNREYTMSVFLTVNTPPVGFTATDVAAYIKALNDWAAVAGNITKLTNNES